MELLAKYLHLIGAIVWLGGMTFMLLALRPVATAQLPPPARLLLLSGVLARFFSVAWISVGLLAATGAYMLGVAGMKNAPIGWHMMMGIGILMFAIFGHLYFGPARRLQTAVAQADWAQAGAQMAKIHPLVVINFVLGWLAIAAVLFLR
ncbi:MAG: CopD family protein [Rhodoferax sp.]